MYIKNESNYIGKLKIYFPIILIQIYLIGTIVLYLFGPLKWETHNKWNFYSLILLYQLSLMFGYYSGIKVKNTSKKNQVNLVFLEKYLMIVIILNIILTILMTVRLSSMTSLSIEGLIERFKMGLTNPEFQYSQKFNTVTYGGKLLTYSSVLLSPLTWTAIPLGMYYFGSISKKIDILVILNIFVEIMHWVIRGTNKGLFDLAIIFSSILMLKYIKGKKRKKISVKAKILLLIFIVLILNYFSNNISGRIGGNFNIISSICGGVEIDTNSGFTKILPVNIQNLVVILSSYLTQGYYAMSMAISLPFSSTMGIGNSIFLMENLKHLLGKDFFYRTYQFKLEQFGWDSQVNWHSFYLWIANDVHFIGVVFVMFLLGYVYANLIKEFLINESILSICLLILFMILFFYIPANNQIAAYPNTCITFMILMSIWLLKKFNIHIIKVNK